MTDRELDALVAEKVMGWAKSKVDNTLTYAVPRYSTFISCAWLVVEEIGKRTGYGVEIEYPCGEMGTWQVRFEASVAGKWVGGAGEADTAPLAICEAALEALK